MSGIIGGVGQLIGAIGGGNSANTDRNQTLRGYGQLNNVYNFGMNQGKAGYGEGMNTEREALGQLGAPAAYYQKLLSGNRPAVMQAVAPTVNAANAQADAQRRNLAAMGTARGGGVNSAMQQQDTSKQATIDNAINQAKSGAAEGATQVAGQVGQIGTSQLSAALKALGLGEEAAYAGTMLSEKSRETSQDIHDKRVEDIGSGLASIYSSALGFWPKQGPLGGGG